MINTPLDCSFDLIAHPYHYIDRRCRYHVTDLYERKVLLERGSVLGGYGPTKPFAYEPATLLGRTSSASVVVTSQNKFAKAQSGITVSGRLSAFFAAAGFAHFAQRMRKQWGKFA